MLLQCAGASAGDFRPLLIAIDGAGGSGKTHVARMLRDCIPSSAVVHTDDVAWHHSFFNWDGMLRKNILEPLRRGRGVEYRPPGWERQGRPGSITVSPGLDLVMVEGTGSSRRSLAPMFNLVIWVDCDSEERRRRCLERDGATAGNIRFFESWDTEERGLLGRDRPWERAEFVVLADSTLPYDPDNEIVVQSQVPR